MSNNIADLLGLSSPPPLRLGDMLLALVLAAVLSWVLAQHFVRRGRTLTNRLALARQLPFLCLTTVLIITVVKSSLALSLGLVGALSIVRFRTPVKEPEELAYIFMSLAIGLGLGAGQWMAVLVSTALILGFLSVRTELLPGDERQNLYLDIEIPSDDAPSQTFERLKAALVAQVRSVDVRRLDIREGLLLATFFIDCDSDQELLGAMDALRDNFPAANISFLEQGSAFGA